VCSSDLGCDWLPTLVELCGVTPPDAAVDGKSLLPVIQSASAITPQEVLHWQIGLGPKVPWAVRQGDWKLLGNPVDPTSTAPLADTDPLFLTNLKQDIGETRNLAGEFPDKVRSLRELHEKWLDDVRLRDRG
jgi:arylsulfatase A-like enzyme